MAVLHNFRAQQDRAATAGRVAEAALPQRALHPLHPALVG